MGTIRAIPKPQSYVTEWEAIQITGSTDDLVILRRLVKNTPWLLQIVLLANDAMTFMFTRTHSAGMEQWTVGLGDWVVKSPHDKFWFMSESEFQGEFTWVKK
jgi:hypothetical protein